MMKIVWLRILWQIWPNKIASQQCFNRLFFYSSTFHGHDHDYATQARVYAYDDGFNYYFWSLEADMMMLAQRNISYEVRIHQR